VRTSSGPSPSEELDDAGERVGRWPSGSTSSCAEALTTLKGRTRGSVHLVVAGVGGRTSPADEARSGRGGTAGEDALQGDRGLEDGVRRAPRPAGQAGHDLVGGRRGGRWWRRRRAGEDDGEVTAAADDHDPAAPGCEADPGQPAPRRRELASVGGRGGRAVGGHGMHEVEGMGGRGVMERGREPRETVNTRGMDSCFRRARQEALRQSRSFLAAQIA
jgi:hypothetical protein